MTKKNFLDNIIQQCIKSAQNSDEVISTLSQHRLQHILPQTLGMAFEKLSSVTADGFSAELSVEELAKIHPDFKTENGCSWARSDNSYLGKKYQITRQKKAGKVTSVKLNGLNDSDKRYRTIRADIRQEIKKKPCVVLDTTINVEVDHKDGRYKTTADIKQQKLEDFQPMHKSVNDAKRQHCKECRETGKRYDARRLGYSIGWTEGDQNTDNCVGCYWHDPYDFNKKISER